MCSQLSGEQLRSASWNANSGTRHWEATWCKSALRWGDSGGWGVASGSGWVCEVHRGARRSQIPLRYQCCDLCLFGSTHSLSCRTRRSGGTDGEVAYALRLCAGLRAGLGVAPRKSGLSHWTRPMLGICVMPRAPHLVHTSGIWGTGIEREASDSTLCRLGQTQSTQESKASKQQASHLLAELRRHDCYIPPPLA